MKNDCLIRFIADGLVHAGSPYLHHELIENLIKAIYPDMTDHSEILPVKDSLALSATKTLLEDHTPSCALGFTPLNSIPYEDYLGYCEELAKRNCFIGLGYDPKRIFNSTLESKHVSRVVDFNRHGLFIEDPELDESVFYPWDEIEVDTIHVNGGFWFLEFKEIQ